MRAQKTRQAPRKKTEDKTANAPAPAGPKPPKVAKSVKSEADRKQEAFDLVLETVEALISERGEDEKVWGSMVKQALKRRKPGFNETYYGFKSFNDLLEEARQRQLLGLERDEKSGGYLIRTVSAPG